ncbi:MAG: sulfurtransferase TusA family protein, partial [Nitrospirales bacterium]
ADTLAEYDQLVAAKGLMPETYRNLTSQMDDLGSKDASTAFLQGKLEFARNFVGVCRTATDEMGQDLKLAPVELGETQPFDVQSQETLAETTTPDAPVFDLRGVMCPMNYVKTKLKMEMMDDGDQLEVWLDAGDPIKNVPMSLRNDGHKVLIEEALDTEKQHYKILVEKVED